MFPYQSLNGDIKNLPGKVRWILGLFHLQFGLLILFTPIQLFFFNGLSLNGFLANLIAVPLYSFLLVPLILFAVLTNGAFSSWHFSNAIAQGITQCLSFFQGSYMPISINLSLILTALLTLVFGGCYVDCILHLKGKQKHTAKIKSNFSH